MVKVEIENNGTMCTKASINGVPFVYGVESVDIHIKGGQKPIMILKTSIDDLKINGEEVQIYREKNKINIKKRILKIISKIKYRAI